MQEDFNSTKLSLSQGAFCCKGIYLFCNTANNVYRYNTLNFAIRPFNIDQ